MSYPREIEIEDKPCPMGCPAGDDVLFTGRDRLHGLPGEFMIVQCRTCELRRTNPRPTPKTMGFYYPEDYGPYQSTQVAPNLPFKPSPSAWKQMVLRALDRKRQKIPPLHPGRLLEIGCASGSYLAQMAALGWKVEGLEFSEKAAERARSLGYPVYSGALETAPEPAALYDLIVGWNVFEHLHYPLAALQKLKRWTPPGGWLVLSLPDAGSFEWRLFKEKWYALHLPNHLYHYTLKTVSRILQKGGWEVNRVLWENNPNNLLQSLRYICIDRDWNTTADYLLDMVQGKRYRALHRLLGTFLGAVHASGRMIVWARGI